MALKMKSPVTISLSEPQITDELVCGNVTIGLHVAGQSKEWALGRKCLTIGEPSIDILNAGAFGCRLNSSISYDPKTYDLCVNVAYKFPLRREQEWRKCLNLKSRLEPASECATTSCEPSTDVHVE